MKTEIIMLRLEPEMKELIQKLAKDNERNMSTQITYMIKQYINTIKKAE